MKKIIVLFTFMAFAMVTVGQGTGYLTTTDFQKEKQQLTAQIKAAKAPAYQLRELYTKQQVTIDSLMGVVAAQQKTIASSEAGVASMKTEVEKMAGQLDDSNATARHRLIYLIIIICLGLLVSFLLLYLVWARISRKMSGMITDQEKTNEALNLHVKNSDEEHAKLADGIAQNAADFRAALARLQQDSDRKLADISDEIKLTLVKAEEKIQANKSSIMAITGELETRTTQLASSGNELKIFIEKALADLNQQTKSLDDQLKVLTDKSSKLDKLHADDLKKVGDTLAELKRSIDEHQKKAHK
jgi:uncharacterized coiled-coil protein SlyX